MRANLEPHDLTRRSSPTLIVVRSNNPNAFSRSMIRGSGPSRFELTTSSCPLTTPLRFPTYADNRWKRPILMFSNHARSRASRAGLFGFPSSARAFLTPPRCLFAMSPSEDRTREFLGIRTIRRHSENICARNGWITVFVRRMLQPSLESRRRPSPTGSLGTQNHTFRPFRRFTGSSDTWHRREAKQSSPQRSV